MRVSPSAVEYFRQEILSYWTVHGRHNLPWRKVNDPWKLLLAEITLRKTTSKQAAEIYPELSKLTPQKLASANPSEIELLLQPLGLQRIRAQNVIQIGKIVASAGIEALNSEEFLRSLPGVGNYIVNAVRCNAFGISVPTLDTNMIRVIKRVFGYNSIHTRPREDQALWKFAAELVHPHHPREFNWGVLDFGAQVCTATSPQCASCPLQKICSYYQSTVKDEGILQTASNAIFPTPEVNFSPTVVSLFSGAGGFDWGFHRAGYNTLLACELLPDAAKTLASNLGLKTTTPEEFAGKLESVVIQGNIEQIDFTKVSIQPDVLIGGPPCQDFSVSKAHERQGLNGGRGHLYREFVRSVMYFQPKLFVFENVPGLTSANKGLAFRTILNDLRHLEDRRRDCVAVGALYSVPELPVQNYVILFKNIVDAMCLGVPQIRRRLILIGMREDLFATLSPTNRAVVINGIEQRMYGTTMMFSRYPLTSIEAFEGKPLPDLQAEYRRIMEQYKDLSETVTNQRARFWKESVWDCLKLDVIKDYLSANQQQNGNLNFSSPEFEKAMQEHEELLQQLDWLNKPVSQLELTDGSHLLTKQSQQVIERMYHIPPDENADFVVGTPWEVESKQISFIYRRTAPLKPAMTVMAYGGGGTHGYHYERFRSALTLRERARLQTFTDEFLFYGRAVRAQIGEAVPPLLGQHIAGTLRDILSITG